MGTGKIRRCPIVALPTDERNQNDGMTIHRRIGQVAQIILNFQDSDSVSQAATARLAQVSRSSTPAGRSSL